MKHDKIDAEKGVSCYERACSYEKEGDVLKAAREFQKAAELGCGYTDNLKNAARLYIDLQEYDRAILILERLSEENGVDGQINGYLGRAYFLKGEKQRALEELKKGAEKESGDPVDSLVHDAGGGFGGAEPVGHDGGDASGAGAGGGKETVE